MNIKKLLIIPFLLLSTVGLANGADYQLSYKGSSSIGTSNIDFSGSGQNDINITGTYSGDAGACYEVAVTATSTMKWRASCSFGDYTTSVSMTTSAVEIEKGIFLSWDTATGHTATDSWKFKVKAINPFKISDASGANLWNLENDSQINIFNSQLSSNNAFLGMKVTDAVGSTYVSLNRENVSVSGTIALTAADSGKVYMSDTAANAKTYTLPPAAAGLKFTFIVQGTGLLTVAENGGDTITCGASSGGVSVTSATADDVIVLLGTGASDWVCTAVLPTEGDWTYN